MSDTPSILQDRLSAIVFAFDDPVRKEAVRHLAREVGSVERELAAMTQERDALRDALRNKRDYETDGREGCSPSLICDKQPDGSHRLRVPKAVRFVKTKETTP